MRRGRKREKKQRPERIKEKALNSSGEGKVGKDSNSIEVTEERGGKDVNRWTPVIIGPNQVFDQGRDYEGKSLDPRFRFFSPPFWYKG